jgi:urease alpha subunit
MPGYWQEGTVLNIDRIQVNSYATQDMKLNDATPRITVDPETYKVSNLCVRGVSR